MNPGFLISSYPRCGTHMLVSALQKHPDLTVHGEVFCPTAIDGDHGITETSKVLGEFWDGPMTGFAAHAYIGRHNRVFKANPRIFGDLWQKLPKNIPVISLRRKDLLARHVSHLRAQKQKDWVRFSGRGNKRFTVKVDPTRLKTDAQDVKECWRKVDVEYPNREVVFYEDLVHNWEETIARVLDAIGCDRAELSPETQRQNPPFVLTEDVKNFEQIHQWRSAKSSRKQLLDGTVA